MSLVRSARRRNANTSQTRRSRRAALPATRRSPVPHRVLRLELDRADHAPAPQVVARDRARAFPTVADTRIWVNVHDRLRGGHPCASTEWRRCHDQDPAGVLRKGAEPGQSGARSGAPARRGERRIIVAA